MLNRPCLKLLKNEFFLESRSTYKLVAMLARKNRAAKYSATRKIIRSIAWKNPPMSPIKSRICVVVRRLSILKASISSWTSSKI